MTYTAYSCTLQNSMRSPNKVFTKEPILRSHSSIKTLSRPLLDSDLSLRPGPACLIGIAVSGLGSRPAHSQTKVLGFRV